MNKLTATLAHSTHNQRFYKLSIPITKGISCMRGKIIDLPELLIYERDNHFKPEFRHLCPMGSIGTICVSDANSHKERLVFAASSNFPDHGKGNYGRTGLMIDGCFTMMIYGGNKRTMKPDWVYIRRLAKVNGLEFHYSDLKLPLCQEQ